MFNLITLSICLFLFAGSLYLFSKSAGQRAISRTEYFYSEQIREEAIRIRTETEKLRNQLIAEDSNREEIVNQTISDVDIKKGPIIPTPIEPALETNDNLTELPPRSIELKELELDEKAITFVNALQSKQEEVNLVNEVTMLEEATSWFNFPEVDLLMSERPERGLFYVAGKVTEILDETSAIVSDGTAERLVYHHKVRGFSVGDVFIAQVEIHKRSWNFIHLWEINESSSELDRNVS